MLSEFGVQALACGYIRSSKSKLKLELILSTQHSSTQHLFSSLAARAPKDSLTWSSAPHSPAARFVYGGSQPFVGLAGLTPKKRPCSPRASGQTQAGSALLPAARGYVDSFGPFYHELRLRKARNHRPNPLERTRDNRMRRWPDSHRLLIGLVISPGSAAANALASPPPRLKTKTPTGDPFRLDTGRGSGRPT